MATVFPLSVYFLHKCYPDYTRPSSTIDLSCHCCWSGSFGNNKGFAKIMDIGTRDKENLCMERTCCCNEVCRKISFILSTTKEIIQGNLQFSFSLDFLEHSLSPGTADIQESWWLSKHVFIYLFCLSFYFAEGGLSLLRPTRNSTMV